MFDIRWLRSDLFEAGHRHLDGPEGPVGFRVWGLGFGVESLKNRVWGLGFGFWSLGQGLGFRV